MPPKHTNAQYRSRLAYDAGSQPAFLRALQAQVSGKPFPTDDEDGGDWEQLDANRPAIPRRPDAPDREAAGSDGEDEGDEKPQVVVLKEGKHLSELEVINEKRRLKGLPPLPPKTDDAPLGEPSTSSESIKISTPASAKQSKVSMGARLASKRKINPETSDTQPKKDTKSSSDGKHPKKKAKKESNNLLSFGDA